MGLWKASERRKLVFGVGLNDGRRGALVHEFAISRGFWIS